MLDRGDECGEPRTCIVIEIECEAVFVNHARLRAAARKKLELPAREACSMPMSNSRI
jgi:hypothetical protein